MRQRGGSTGTDVDEQVKYQLIEDSESLADVTIIFPALSYVIESILYILRIYYSR